MFNYTTTSARTQEINQEISPPVLKICVVNDSENVGQIAKELNLRWLGAGQKFLLMHLPDNFFVALLELCFGPGDPGDGVPLDNIPNTVNLI